MCALSPLKVSFLLLFLLLKLPLLLVCELDTHKLSYKQVSTHAKVYQQRIAALHTRNQIMSLTPTPTCRGTQNITPTFNSIPHTVPTVVHSLLAPLCSMRWHPWMIWTSGKLLKLFRREHTRSVSHVCHVVHHGGHLTKQHISSFFSFLFLFKTYSSVLVHSSPGRLLCFLHLLKIAFPKAKCFIQLYPAFKAHEFFSSNNG